VSPSRTGQTLPRQLAFACALALAATGQVRADRTVVVNSSVDRAYATRRATEPGRIETYVVARGQYYNAIPMDRYLERMDFRTIAKTLAVDLKQQHYEPATSLLTADLVLVIHWGVTQPNETFTTSLLHDHNLLQEAGIALNEAVDRVERQDTPYQPGVPGVLVAVSESQQDIRRESANMLTAHARNETRRQSAIELLGLQSSLHEADKALFGSALGASLQDMMNEERYFVIVMAYDGPAMRAGRKKRLWTTRASIRGPGVNFAVALDRLSDVAAEFYGTPQNGLAFKTSSRDRKRKEAQGEVQIGELKVIGDWSAPAPSGKR
jgi:hypothetical protein